MRKRAIRYDNNMSSLRHGAASYTHRRKKYSSYFCCRDFNKKKKFKNQGELLPPQLGHALFAKSEVIFRALLYDVQYTII